MSWSWIGAGYFDRLVALSEVAGPAGSDQVAAPGCSHGGDWRDAALSETVSFGRLAAAVAAFILSAMYDKGPAGTLVEGDFRSAFGSGLGVHKLVGVENQGFDRDAVEGYALSATVLQG